MADIIYFGRLGETTGLFSESVNLPPQTRTVKDLRGWMDERFDQTGIFLAETVRVALNSEIVTDAHEVTDRDEIAFMPPVGGG